MSRTVIDKTPIPGFSPDEFRDGILLAMNMGTPTEVDKRVTFIWDERKSYQVDDGKGVPFKLSDPGTVVSAARTLQVPLALNFVVRSTLSGGTAISDFQTPRAEITLFEDSYALVKDADRIEIDGDRYDISFVAPPVGLDSVTVYTIHIAAEDES